MKKILIVFAALFVVFNCVAQENRNVREIGVEFTSDDEFGLTYRFGKERSLWRISTSILNVRELEYLSDINDFSSNNVLLQFDFGREFRKQIAPKLDFKYGASVFFGWTESSSSSDREFIGNQINIQYHSKSYLPGLKLIFGLSYQIKQFVFAAELQPSCTYLQNSQAYTITDMPPAPYKMSRLMWQIGSSPILFSATYQF